jgi:hypothetical protein
VVRFREEVRLAALEICVNGTNERIGRVPNASLDSLVGPKSPHVEDKRNAEFPLHPPAGKCGKIASTMKQIERLPPMQVTRLTIHAVHVVHRRHDRRVPVIRQWVPRNASFGANPRDCRAFVRAALRLLEADQADPMSASGQSGKVGKHL